MLSIEQSGFHVLAPCLFGYPTGIGENISRKKVQLTVLPQALHTGKGCPFVILS